MTRLRGKVRSLLFGFGGSQDACKSEFGAALQGRQGQIVSCLGIKGKQQWSGECVQEFIGHDSKLMK